MGKAALAQQDQRIEKVANQLASHVLGKLFPQPVMEPAPKSSLSALTRLVEIANETDEHGAFTKFLNAFASGNEAQMREAAREIVAEG